MTRFKGWAARYRRFSPDQISREIRRIESGRDFIFDRDNKLCYLKREVINRRFPDNGLYSRPDGIIWGIA
jgi:hypothetical protein